MPLTATKLPDGEMYLIRDSPFSSYNRHETPNEFIARRDSHTKFANAHPPILALFKCTEGQRFEDGEVELVWQAWDGFTPLPDCAWFNCQHPHKDYELRGIETRQVYTLKSDKGGDVVEAKKEFQGTPGPWYVTTNIKTLVVPTDRYRSICTTGNWTESLNQEKVDAENEANALLIAAAPELLEALQELVEVSYQCAATAMLQRAKSAINKALNPPQP